MYKVPGGKMLKVRLQAEGSTITDVKIMGDFFLHPESAILEIERALTGVELIEAVLISVVERLLSTNNAILIGAEAKDIAKVVLMASEASSV